jgi:hypothetical protein
MNDALAHPRAERRELVFARLKRIRGDRRIELPHPGPLQGALTSRFERDVRPHRKVASLP